MLKLRVRINVYRLVKLALRIIHFSCFQLLKICIFKYWELYKIIFNYSWDTSGNTSCTFDLETFIDLLQLDLAHVSAIYTIVNKM